MKETHIFYAPDVKNDIMELPQEEATHAIRVLRMKEDDELTLTDGTGFFYEARITLASAKHCQFKILQKYQDQKLWKGSIHIALAPTKSMDRIEWAVEKMTEIGVDEISLLNCANSERRIVKTERLEKIIISAMKQSHKAYKPAVHEMQSFKNFIQQPFAGPRFIAHCYNPEDIYDNAEEVESNKSIHISDQNFLGNLLHPGYHATVLIGPEGDFSIQEVKMAIEAGFTPISLGKSRLRTETAALVAVHLMYLANREI